MIVFIEATVEQLRQEGRNFNWNRPTCTCGCKKVWGHGFVLRILDDCEVELKRFHCPDCGKVFTLRPNGFYPHIQTSILSLYLALLAMLKRGRWPRPSLHQRMRHWMRRFERFAAGYFPTENLISLLERLHAGGVFFLH
jgi:hypothetical protein